MTHPNHQHTTSRRRRTLALPFVITFVTAASACGSDGTGRPADPPPDTGVETISNPAEPPETFVISNPAPPVPDEPVVISNPAPPAD